MKKKLLYPKIKLLTCIITLVIPFLTFSQTSQIFTTNGTFTFIVPIGVNQIAVEAWGGGGKGATMTSNGVGGGGGGGAYAKKSMITVTPGQSYTVEVGVGSTSTSDGGNSNFYLTTTPATVLVRAKGGASVANNSSLGAVGGSALSCIGDVGFVFSGGSGALGSGSNGGGGGSSAGTAAIGNNGTGSLGGTAPLGGGNGGNGMVGSNGGGFPGVAPGAGGGGAYRTTGSPTGGRGANGQIKITYTLPNKMIVQGSGITIADGDMTPSVLDFTNFGTTDVTNLRTRTFSISNLGYSNLILDGTPIVSSNNPNFVITTAPSSTNISAGGNTSFIVTFTPTVIGIDEAIISIPHADSPSLPYTFKIKANVQKPFFDSDGDGIFDNLDIDDDNDGIRDDDEENSCENAAISIVSNYKFLNETFGNGATRDQINTTYDATTTYCYEDGTVGSNSVGCPNLSNIDLNDGEYTVYHKATNGIAPNETPINEVASWADAFWYKGEDHTTGDVNGRMAMFNAAYEPGLFYSASITGALANVPITYSFWVLNLDREDNTMAKAFEARIKPNIKVEFRDVNNNILINQKTGLPARIITGDIPYSSATSNQTTDWHQFTSNLTFNVDEFYVYFYNNQPGGLGNDLALDDIVITQTLCDMDADTVADIFDLDSDNDGIPDVVEAGLGNLSGGFAKIPYPAGWVDTNLNGMHDAAESNIPLDSDGDGVPNYLDLDSDNDGIFDVDESGANNILAYVGYQNGDGDINGDGVGDGLDTDAVRETDVDSDGTLEYYTDGILDIYDYFEGGTFALAYGNSSQGLTGAGWFKYVKDTDGDGIPDYMDVMSNGTIFDIASTLYAGLDANLPLNGVIDGTLDSDGDGILDAFDTNNAVFGSPRNIDRKLLLYFDGRNDYAEDVPLISGETSLMGWIKIDAIPTGIQRILGQNNFYLQINTSKQISAVVGGNTLTYATPIDLNRWVHIAATYNCCEFKLYINGVEVQSTSGGTLTADGSSFTIGRKSDSNSNYYRGYIDEVRLFNSALTINELQKIVYQEIENNGGTVRGSVVKLNVADYDFNSTTGIETTTNLHWANLQRYFRMDTYNDDIIDDLSTAAIDTGSGAKIYNIKILDVQTAPLPFITQKGSTDLADALSTTKGINGNDAITSPASIVKIEHDGVHYNGNQQHVALFVKDGTEYSVKNDTELNVSWYLYLNGAIDLEGESQLVQGGESILDANSGGYIERDQQGTANSYNYNYWTSSVGTITSKGSPLFTPSANAGFTISNILRDGSVADNATYPRAISFNAALNWADAGSTAPIKISTYWLYKFYGLDDDYNAWIKINQTTPLAAGEGYTMKGTSGNIAISTNQNYVFKGKPYNGNITLELKNSDGIERDRLIGNPYPSAMDADEFIKDNIKATINGKVGRNTNNVFNGALYFWDHFGQIGSHVLKQYVGGYATYTLMGGTQAIANDSRINTTSGLISSKTPERYIPVNQGFFVITALDTAIPTETTPDIDGGTIVFKNTQRYFKKEGATAGLNTGSVFMKSEKRKDQNSAAKTENKDLRSKIRLLFDSPTGYHRQLLIGVDENTTNNFDLGYDGLMVDIGTEDVFWIIDGAKSVIQGVPNFNEDQEFPIGLKVSTTGLARIRIESLENVDTSTDIFIKDALTGKTTPINNSPFEITLDAGTYLNRFSLTFAPQNVLGIEDGILEQGVQVYMNNASNEIQINNNIQAELINVKLYNSLGQIQNSWNSNLEETNMALPIINKATGMYLVQVNTTKGTISKKVVIE